MSENQEVISAGLTPEQEELLQKLQTIKAATEQAKPRCPQCGSDLHGSCGSPASVR